MYRLVGCWLGCCQELRVSPLVWLLAEAFIKILWLFLARFLIIGYTFCCFLSKQLIMRVVWHYRFDYLVAVMHLLKEWELVTYCRVTLRSFPPVSKLKARVGHISSLPFIFWLFLYNCNYWERLSCSLATLTTFTVTRISWNYSDYKAKDRVLAVKREKDCN